MNISEIKKKVELQEYDFLRTNPRLRENIILLGLGGSHAYGMENENSDLDIRGIATNSKKDILIGNDFEQIVDIGTDTTIYSFNKIIKLLCNCNPNVIELLGLKPEHYLYLSQSGKKLIENRKMFLSKKAIHSFGGYANSQLRRLENKSARVVTQTSKESHILKTIEHASIDFKKKYSSMPEDGIRLYIDAAVNESLDAEIFFDINLRHYPLRDYCGLWNEMSAIVKSYSKIGMRNEKAITHDKFGKHMAHLIRLYLMCFDILEKGEIITYREKDRDFLLAIRNGKYLDENRQPTEEFYKIVDRFEEHLQYLSFKTALPEDIDKNQINNFVMEVNESVCLG